MLIAEFTLSSPVLRDALAAAPGVSVDLERTSENSRARLAVLARGQDLDRFENALTTDPSVSETAVRARGPTFGQYEVTLSPEGAERATGLWWQQLEADPLSATGTHHGWELRMRFPSRAALSAFRDRCRERDVSFTLHDLYVRDDFDTDDEFGLNRERPRADG